MASPSPRSQQLGCDHWSWDGNGLEYTANVSCFRADFLKYRYLQTSNIACFWDFGYPHCRKPPYQDLLTCNNVQPCQLFQPWSLPGWDLLPVQQAHLLLCKVSWLGDLADLPWFLFSLSHPFGYLPGQSCCLHKLPKASNCHVVEQKWLASQGSNSWTLSQATGGGIWWSLLFIYCRYVLPVILTTKDWHSRAFDRIRIVSRKDLLNSVDDWNRPSTGSSKCLVAQCISMYVKQFRIGGRLFYNSKSFFFAKQSWHSIKVSVFLFFATVPAFGEVFLTQLAWEGFFFTSVPGGFFASVNLFNRLTIFQKMKGKWKENKGTWKGKDMERKGTGKWKRTLSKWKEKGQENGNGN